MNRASADDWEYGVFGNARVIEVPPEEGGELRAFVDE